MNIAQVEAIFQRALELPALEERVIFLSSACGGHQALRAKVTINIPTKHGYAQNQKMGNNEEAPTATGQSRMLWIWEAASRNR
jgi:hypothetical protein